jgi:hypothetical protein
MWENYESLLDNDKQPWLSDIVLPHNDDEGEMERERDTTEQEESLLDNDKQPWLSDIVLPHNDDVQLCLFLFPFHLHHHYVGELYQIAKAVYHYLADFLLVQLCLFLFPKVKWKEKETQLNKKKVC